MKLSAKPARVEAPMSRALAAICLVLLLVFDAHLAHGADVADRQPAAQTTGSETNSGPHFNIQAYAVRGDTLLTNYPAERFSEYTGTNVTISDIIRAASRLQREHFALGYSNLSVAISRERITNGIVTMNVFRSRIPRLLISGKAYELAPVEATGQAGVAAQSVSGRAGATASAAPGNAQTNAGPRFTVMHYEIHGDTLLSTEALMKVLAKYTGTNLGIADIVKAASDLQMEYQARGFPTVRVTIPEQRITNDIVKFRVVEGRLEDITVVGNRYFSSNNVIRSLPSLRTNTILNGPVFQAELDRANANQDRQIYPEIEPGPTEGTSDLTLRVKDRLPLHAKVELNNQSSPGTPELRLNTSAVYNNLWQYEHSLGVQYSFSPTEYKTGDQWAFYDRPLVANYSAFYRLPLGGLESVGNVVASQPGSFGYDEAARRFRLPAPSGRPELNFFASRSTIDTGVENLSDKIIQDIPGVLSIREQDVQQDLTVNGDIGGRLTIPVKTTANFQSGVSGGLDYKTYSLTSSKTNIFSFSIITVNPDGTPNPPVTSTVASPVPATQHSVGYVPVSFHYDASLRDRLGVTSFGLGLGGNSWFSGSLSNLQAITGSSQSSGYWFVLNPSLSRDLNIHTNWTLSLRADGQWANQPLISTEQFGVGGVNSVRGYREGEVFGDNGWHVSVEQKTPGLVVGNAYGQNPLTLRGSVYMDYGISYLIDPNGRPGHVPLWGVGFGGAANIGPHWGARFLFSWPLLGTSTTSAGQPRFDFGLNAQF